MPSAIHALVVDMDKLVLSDFTCRRSAGLWYSKARIGETAGAPVASRNTDKGLRRDNKPVSAVLEPTSPSVVGNKPSNTAAAALFALTDSGTLSRRQVTMLPEIHSASADA